MVGRVAHRAGGRNQGLGIEPQGHPLRNESREDDIEVETQMLVVLFDGANRQQRSFQLSPFQRLPDLLAGAFPQHHLIGMDIALVHLGSFQPSAAAILRSALLVFTPV